MSDNPYQTPQVNSVLSDAGGADPKLDRVVDMLRQTKPWVRFISVMTTLGSAFMMLGGLFIVAGAAAGAMGPLQGVNVAVGVVYIVMALFYIIPAVFLWRYASRIALFVEERSTGALASALEAQKSFWKFVGILMLVVLAIYAVMIVVISVVAVVASM